MKFVENLCKDAIKDTKPNPGIERNQISFYRNDRQP